MNRSAPLPDNVAGALCYLVMPLSAFAFLLLEPFSRRGFVRFHAMQAIFTFGAMVAASIGMRILVRVLFILPFIGRLAAALLLMGMSVGFIALWIFLMYQALQGKRYRLPWIGDWASAQAG